MVLVSASANCSTTLENLDDMADKIVEVATPTVVAVSPVCVDDSDIKQLREELSQLADLVASLSRAHRSCCRTPSRTHPLEYTTSQPIPSQDVLCWYHAPMPRNVESLATGTEKQRGWLLAATGMTSQTPSRLFYVTDSNTHTCFLVDISSEVSVIPYSPFSNTHTSFLIDTGSEVTVIPYSLSDR